MCKSLIDSTRWWTFLMDMSCTVCVLLIGTVRQCRAFQSIKVWKLFWNHDGVLKHLQGIFYGFNPRTDFWFLKNMMLPVCCPLLATVGYCCWKLGHCGYDPKTKQQSPGLKKAHQVRSTVPSRLVVFLTFAELCTMNSSPRVRLLMLVLLWCKFLANFSPLHAHYCVALHLCVTGTVLKVFVCTLYTDFT